MTNNETLKAFGEKAKDVLSSLIAEYGITDELTLTIGRVDLNNTHQNLLALCNKVLIEAMQKKEIAIEVKEKAARSILHLPKIRCGYLKTRFEIFKRDNFSCSYCGRSAKDGVQLHVDHIKPVAGGGDDTPDNLTTACLECNLGKRDFLLTARHKSKLSFQNIKRY